MTSLPPAMFAAVALTASVLDWQPPADFSGTWVIDEARSESPQDPSFEAPTVVIVQNDRELIVETPRPTGARRATYAIGAPSAPTDAAAIAVPRAYWDGAVLVAEASRTIQGQTVSVRERRRLDPTGREMTVETLLVVQHGYTFKGARNYGAATDVYRRSAP